VGDVRNPGFQIEKELGTALRHALVEEISAARCAPGTVSIA